MLTHEEITVKIYEAVRRTERLLGEKGTDLVAPIREATKQPARSAPNPPKQGPLSKTELLQAIERCLPDIPIHARPYAVNALEKLFTTYTNSLLDEAIGGKQLVKHMDFQDEAVPVAALEALRDRLG